MWDLPGPGLEPMAPALAGGFLTTAPPGKSLLIALFNEEKGDIRLGAFKGCSIQPEIAINFFH